MPTVNKVFLFYPGYGEQGKKGRAMPLFLLLLFFQYIFRLIPYCCLRSTVNRCVPDSPTPHTLTASCMITVLCLACGTVGRAAGSRDRCDCGYQGLGSLQAEYSVTLSLLAELPVLRTM